MIVNDAFDKFLENIEPDSRYKNHAAEAHTRVRDYLQSEDSQFSENVIDSFLYGSYARHTAEGNIKDVDIAIITNFDPASEDNTPSKVLPKLKKALTRLYKDPGATDYQRKSIQVLDPLPDEPEIELTLDVIPVVLTGTDQNKVLVPDTESDQWVESHPKSHLNFTSTLNDEQHGQGMFVPLVKIMKHWWKQHSGIDKAKPKGFWLEVLTGYMFDASIKTYSEHFISILSNISKQFSDYESRSEVPTLEDPGLPGETLKTSMTLVEFVHFMDAVNDTLALAQEALASQDENESIHLWNSIFGEDFPTTEKSSSLDLSRIVEFIKTFTAPKEQYLRRDFGISFESSKYWVKIDAWVTENKGFRPNYSSKLPLIQKKAKLLFKIINSEVPEDYKVMWKVKNTGREAARKGQQRGEIVWDLGGKEKEESTLYTGTHFVECYIIDIRNVCIAWDRIKIRIP
jgi:predicted nucleotidyltransferase